MPWTFHVRVVPSHGIVPTCSRMNLTSGGMLDKPANAALENLTKEIWQEKFVG